jgi:predicted CXXCH cytochrome family protein
MGLRRLTLLVFVSLAAAGASMQAGADAAPNTLLPAIPEGLGERCVEDTDFMRRNHMELLKHQRDETVLKGVRTEQYSLKECFNCHVVYGPDAKAVTAASPAHFCRACHDYAAVSIDCFDCHASRPEAADLPPGHSLSSHRVDTPAASGSD